MACLSGDLGALSLSHSNTLSVVLVLSNLPWDLLALLLGHLLTFSLGHLSLNLILDCVATFLGDSDTDISLNIMTLLFRYSVFDLLWSVEALLLGDSLALLPWYRSADRNIDIVTLLNLFIVCVLLGYILT